ncbi:hypothetical protein A2311_01310, partial [candidate division WOR-1 bacterium RIFOXYB2_FULL_48_7]
TTQKLDKILNIDEKARLMTIQPGISLEQIDLALQKRHLLYPPDPTEKKATIGGNISTNASGGRCYRFGATRDWIKRLRIQLLNGETLDIKRGEKVLGSRFDVNELLKDPQYQTPNIKCSAGYYSRPNMDLIDLFIGSEGTLGVITEVDIGLYPAFVEIFDLVAFFASEEKAVDFVLTTKRSNQLSTQPPINQTTNFYEFFDENTLQMLRPAYPHIPADAKAAIYVEEELNEINQQTYFDDWSARLEKYGVVLEDCWLGITSKQKEELAKFRHAIPEHINELFKLHHQTKIATDIAVPEDKFLEMFDYYTLELSTSNLFYIKFGHIGDNHLHVNLLAREEKDLTLAQALVLKFIKKAVSLGGTASAEHGIGKLKVNYLKEMYSKKALDQMLHVKKHFDPKLILGKGNLFNS